MEYERNRREAPAPKKRNKRRGGGVAGSVLRLLFTLILVGCCTGAMMVWIFMNYVDTTLAPTLQIRAEDYTMELSSFIYYQDKETGEWVEYQTIYGQENREYVDI